jgi:HTH-type transcriptional regulator/antitoxin HigA
LEEEISSVAAEITDAKEYAHLLRITFPHVIQIEAENERCPQILESFLRKKKRSKEERLTELLTLLIEDLEEREYPMSRKAGPIDIVRHLMDANGLRQTGLLDVFGTASVISEVLKGQARAFQDSHCKAERAFPRFARVVLVTQPLFLRFRPLRHAVDRLMKALIPRNFV